MTPPAEHIVNGMELCGPWSGAIALVALPPLIPPKMPPSPLKIRPASKPGLFVGIPLKPRHEIWSRAIKFSGTGDAVVVIVAVVVVVAMLCTASVTLAPVPGGGDGTARGICFGEMASETRGVCLVTREGVCEKANCSRAGNDVPRISIDASEVRASAWPILHKLRQRSASVV